MDKEKITKQIKNNTKIAIILTIAAFLAIFAIGLSALSFATNQIVYEFSDTYERYYQLQKMELSFIKMQSIAEKFVNHKNPSAIMDDVRMEFNVCRDQLLSHGNMYIDLSYIQLLDSEAENAKNLMGMITHYSISLESIFDLSLANDSEGLEAMIAEIQPLSKECENLLLNLAEISAMRAEERVHYIASHTQRYNLLFYVALFMSLFGVLIPLTLIYKGSKKLKEESVPDRYNELISNSNRNEKVTEPTDSGKMLLEFDRRLEELKAVCYDLSRMTKGGR